MMVSRVMCIMSLNSPHHPNKIHTQNTSAFIISNLVLGSRTSLNEHRVPIILTTFHLLISVFYLLIVGRYAIIFDLAYCASILQIRLLTILN